MFPRVAVVIVCLLLAVIGTLAALTVIRYNEANNSAKHMRVLADTKAFRTVLENYRKENGSYPTSEQGLQALVRQKMLGDIPVDDWGTPYIYRCPGFKNPDGFDLFSAGPDRKPDTADDDWGE